MGFGDTENNQRTSKRNLGGNVHTQAPEPSVFGTDFTVAPNVTVKRRAVKENRMICSYNRGRTPLHLHPHPTPNPLWFQVPQLGWKCLYWSQRLFAILLCLFYGILRTFYKLQQLPLHSRSGKSQVKKAASVGGCLSSLGVLIHPPKAQDKQLLESKHTFIFLCSSILLKNILKLMHNCAHLWSKQ